MEGFSISCTTCRARLRVRDARAVGQIIPCPKCGGMVLITRQRQTGSLGQEGGAQALPGTMRSRAPFPRSDSFDNIDRLLDEPLRLPLGPASGRWRTSESLPQEPAAPSSLADEAGHLSTTSDVSESPAEESAESVDDWSVARAALFRPYLLMGGGAIVGFTLALGLAGWYISQPGSDGPSNLQSAAATASERQRQPDEESERPGDGPHEGAQTRAADLGAVKDSPDQAPSDAPNEKPQGLPQDPSPESGTNDPPEAAPASETPPPPTPTAPPPVAPPPAGASDLASGKPAIAPGANNDLAAFAQWLQNPDAAMVPAAPPTAEEPADDPPTENVTALEESPAIQPSRPAPPRVDVAARLDEPISAQLREVPLIDALRFVTQMSTIPIRLEPNALGRRNMRADRKVNVTVRDATVRGLLDAVVKETGLGWFVDGDHVIVTTASDARGKFVTKSHPIADLTDGSAAVAGELAANIQRLVEYGSWTGQGEASDDVPAGRCEADGASVRVTHRDTVHYQILVFCEKLRVARGLSPRTGILQDRISLGSRVADCAALEQTVSVRIGQPRSIDRIAAELSRNVPVQILVDWPSLYLEGWSPQDKETVFYDQQSLHALLNDWLRPKGLAWRVIDRQTLEITTPTAVAVTHDIEFYRLAADQAADQGAAVSRKLLVAIGQDAFEPHGLGAVAYDAPSQTLIVSLPQPQQALASEVCR